MRDEDDLRPDAPAEQDSALDEDDLAGIAGGEDQGPSSGLPII